MSEKVYQKTNIKKPASQEQLLAGFNDLRQQQRAIASKVSELEMEKRDHELVIEALTEVDGDRKCFRLVGGVLVERTVKEVLPALTSNNEQIFRLVATLTTQLESKGSELNAYREKHGFRIRGEEDEASQQQAAASKNAAASGGVLVSKDLT